MNQETVDYIENLTQIIRNTYNIKSNTYNWNQIINLMGGRIKYCENNSSIKNTIKKIDKLSFEIIILAEQDCSRESFSIAHELGHLFLHMGFRIDSQQPHD